MKPYRLSREFAIRACLPLLAALAGMLLLASCASEGPKPGAGADAKATVKILNFYPGQPSFAPGDQAQICYGVENAVSVRLEPPVAEIRPLSVKCVWFKPSGSMKLTLVATGTDGREARETIDITVKAGAPASTSLPPEAAGDAAASGGTLIETFVATATSIPPGGGATVCYVLREPATVTLQPPSGELGGDLRKCILLRPSATTTYTLTARAGGKTEHATVTIRVE